MTFGVLEDGFIIWGREGERSEGSVRILLVSGSCRWRLRVPRELLFVTQHFGRNELSLVEIVSDCSIRRVTIIRGII